MDICNYNHEEICFASKICPLCQLIDKHDKNDRYIKAKCSDLEDNVNKLEKQIDALREAGR